MELYKNSTQTPNVLFDHLLKVLRSRAQLCVLLIIIKRTIGTAHPTIKGKRVERAWISQKLFMVCGNLSGKSVSMAVDSLVRAGYIEVTDEPGNIMHSKKQRRACPRLYYASRLRLVQNKKQVRETSCDNGVDKCHTIKLRNKNISCGQMPQGTKRLTDRQRYLQIRGGSSIKNMEDTI